MKFESKEIKWEDFEGVEGVITNKLQEIKVLKNFDLMYGDSNLKLRETIRRIEYIIYIFI